MKPPKCQGPGCPEQATVRVIWSGAVASGTAVLCDICSMEQHQLLLPYISTDESFQIVEQPLQGESSEK